MRDTVSEYADTAREAVRALNAERVALERVLWAAKYLLSPSQVTILAHIKNELPQLLLESLDFSRNSDDFVFDNQMLAQCVYFGFKIGEVSCPTKYFEEASSINFRRSVKYGLGVMATSLMFALQKSGLARLRIFSDKGRKLEPGVPTYYARGAAGGQ